jgi:heavy metal sensor kinase
LLGLGQTLGKLFQQQPALLGPERALGDERSQELLDASHSIRVLDLDGSVLWEAAASFGAPRIPMEVLEQGKVGKIVYESVYTTAGMRLRRIVMPIREQGDVRYLLQLETSLAMAERTLRGLMWLLLLTSMAMMLVTWLGSDWLARKTLGTIRTLSRAAEQVSEASFDDRVKVDAPYREFQQLAHAFNSMLDRLQKAYDTERHFVDYAAHQIQTPLTILQGNLEVILQKERSAEECREVLVSNLNQVERLMRLTKSLLALARFTSGRRHMHFAPVKLEPLLGEVVEDFALLAADRNIRLSLEAESAPAVLGDALELKQLVINLLDNALRHTDSGGEITVHLRATGDAVTIAVKDTGHGIDSKHLPHLFDRFYRADTGTARDSGGTGLGLPIVKEIATAHHGMMSVESEIGRGSTFTLTLPLSPQLMKH